jgi:hypothetical protein
VASFTCELTASGAKLRWAATPGRTYQLESTMDLPASSWLPEGEPVAATAAWVEVVIPQSQVAADARRFFRVRTAAP